MTLLYETPRNGVALITLNRPDKLNSFNGDMRDALTDALRRVSGDKDIRVLVLTGAGRGFSAGADLTDGTAGANLEDQLTTEYHRWLSMVQIISKPVIAAINGPAAGIGMSLALSCDLRVMAENAYLMSAFANIGLVPDGGLTYLLAQEVGYARAYQMMIEAEKIGAGKALELGLINRVAKEETLLEETLDWAAQTAKRAPLALGLTKRALRASAQSGLQQAMAHEAELQQRLAVTKDFREGVTALFEKRAPNFTGQ